MLRVHETAWCACELGLGELRTLKKEGCPGPYVHVIYKGVINAPAWHPEGSGSDVVEKVSELNTEKEKENTLKSTNMTKKPDLGAKVEAWSNNDVIRWLNYLGYDEFHDLFYTNGESYLSAVSSFRSFLFSFVYTICSDIVAWSIQALTAVYFLR